MVNRLTILKNVCDQSSEKSTWLAEDIWRGVFIHGDSLSPTDSVAVLEGKGECSVDIMQ